MEGLWSEEEYTFARAIEDNRMTLALGRRRLDQSMSLSSPPLLKFSTPSGVIFDCESLKSVRDSAVFSTVEVEVAGVGYLKTKKVFSLCDRSIISGKDFTTDPTRFYVEFHTHPLFAVLNATSEIISPPSGSDISSLSEQYFDGVALSLVLAPNGIFSMWLSEEYQRALCYWGLGFEGLLSNFKKSRRKIDKRPEALYRLVTRGALSHGNEFGEKIFDGHSICESGDRATGAYELGQPPPWCFYKWSPEQEALSNEWSKKLGDTFTLNGLEAVIKKYCKSEFRNPKATISLSAEAISIANNIPITEARKVSLIKSQFTPWHAIETRKTISLAPMCVFKEWIPPADRFLICNPMASSKDVTFKRLTSSHIERVVSEIVSKTAAMQRMIARVKMNKRALANNVKTLINTREGCEVFLTLPDSWKFCYEGKKSQPFFSEDLIIKWAVAMVVVHTIVKKIDPIPFVVKKYAKQKTYTLISEKGEHLHPSVFFTMWALSGKRRTDLDAMRAPFGDKE